MVIAQKAAEDEDKKPDENKPEDSDDEKKTTDTPKDDSAKKKTKEVDLLREVLMKELPAESVNAWFAVIYRVYNAHVTLITEPASETELIDKIKDTDAFKMRGVTGSSCFGIFYCFSTGRGEHELAS